MLVVNYTAAIAKICTAFQVSAYGGGTGIAVPLPLQLLGLPGYLELGILYKVSSHPHIARFQSNDWVNGSKLSMAFLHSALSCASTHQNMKVLSTVVLPWWLSRTTCLSLLGSRVVWHYSWFHAIPWIRSGVHGDAGGVLHQCHQHPGGGEWAGGRADLCNSLRGHVPQFVGAVGACR